jgi:flagella synthesis protein FlgN
MSDKLLTLLRREHAQISQFLELLDAEAEQMMLGQYTGLQDLAAKKLTQAGLIAGTSAERNALQIKLGFAAGRQGAQAAAAGSTTLEKTWQDLLAIAAQAHQSNYRNGVMIHTQLDFTREAIGFLQARGQSLYGADGAHKASASGGKPLAVG